MGNISTRRSSADKLTVSAGKIAEDFACAYLKRQGLRFVMRNFRARGGEIDLVMRDKHNLVFIEVRYRQAMSFGGALASVHWHKQRRIITAAKHFIQLQPIVASLPCRFDVITLAGSLTAPTVEWVKDAFQAGE